jgi:hypothetical protein
MTVSSALRGWEAQLKLRSYIFIPSGWRVVDLGGQPSTAGARFTDAATA